MSLLDRIVDRLDRAFTLTPEEQRQAGFGLTVSRHELDKPRWLDHNVHEYRKAFANQVAVYSCVLARARGVSSATLRVYQDRGGNKTEIPDHELRTLIQNPNPAMSEAEWLVMTQTLMDATGFCIVEKERAGAGNVIGLWHLRSDWLKEIRRSKAPSDWEYKVPGRDKAIIKAEDVIVIPGGPSTDLRTTGMSPIAVALREVGIDAAMTDFLKLFIDKGGVPPYALVTEASIRDEADAEWHRGLWAQAFGGFRNWAKTPILSGGFDVKKIGSTMDEFAYPELRALTEAHICSVFGVPPIIAGIQAGLDAATYSNYAQARKAFFEDTIAGLWARLDGALTRGLLSEFTDDQTVSIEFDTSDVPALQEDKGLLRTWARESLSAGGMTLNQYQMAVGQPGFGEAGDVLYVPLGVTPTKPDDLLTLAGFAAKPPQPVPAALAEGGEGDDDSGSSGAGTTDTGASEEAGEGDRARVVATGTPGRATAPGTDGHRQGELAGYRLLTLPLETRARIATTNRRNQNRIAAKHGPRLRAMFRKQGEVVASAYASATNARMDTEEFLAELQPATVEEARHAVETRALEHIPWTDIEAEMERELSGLYEAAGRLAFASASTALDEVIDWSLANPKIRQVMNRLGQRIVGVNQTTRKDVAAVVTAGLEDGLSIVDISDNLRGLFAETYRGRALAISRTESMVSYSLATTAAYAESGIVQALTLHDNPAHVDEYGATDGLSCAQRDGVITDVDNVELHIFSEHPNGSLAVSPLLVRPLGAA